MKKGIKWLRQDFFFKGIKIYSQEPSRDEMYSALNNYIVIIIGEKFWKMYIAGKHKQAFWDILSLLNRELFKKGRAGAYDRGALHIARIETESDLVEEIIRIIGDVNVERV